MSKNSPEAASGNGAAPLKVLLVSQAPGVGGGERVVLGPIARTGLDVTVAAWPEVAAFSRELGLEAIDMKLPFVRGLTQMPALISGAMRIARTARRVNAAVLYANGSRAITYCLAATRFGAPPLLIHHHGFLGKGRVGLFRAGARRWATSILAPSKAIANDLDAPGKTSVIPYGIDLTRFAPTKQRVEAKRSFGLDPGAFVMGYVMRAAPGKGIEDFLSAIPLLEARFPEMQFLLAGGPLFDDDRAYFEEISSRASVPTLRLTGKLEDTAPAYAAMDVFVHLAEPEGFPTTAIEALASGVPVIGYEWGGLTELLAGKAGTLVPPRDVVAAADAVAALASSPNIQQQASSAARSLAETRYSIERFAHDLEKAVRQAARSTR